MKKKKDFKEEKWSAVLNAIESSRKIRTEKKVSLVFITIEAFVRESFNRWVSTVELKSIYKQKIDKLKN